MEITITVTENNLRGLTFAAGETDPAEYLHARIAELLENYSEAEITARINSPENQALIRSIASKTDAEIAAIKSAIDQVL